MMKALSGSGLRFHLLHPIDAGIIRTFWFITAMVPILMLVCCLLVIAFILMIPVMLYAGIKGVHLKDPWSPRDGLM